MVFRAWDCETAKRLFGGVPELMRIQRQQDTGAVEKPRRLCSKNTTNATTAKSETFRDIARHAAV